MTTIAIMQPYFMPYTGYFRLFSVADHLVFLDSVRFSRNPGYVIRNKLTNKQNEQAWLTLPIEKPLRSAQINELRFRASARQDLVNQYQRFPSLLKSSSDANDCHQLLLQLQESVSLYNQKLLRFCCDALELPFNTSLSSDITLSTTDTGQTLLITIAKHFKAKTYINLSGGLELYDRSTFAKHGIELKILAPYQGNYVSMLERLIEEDPKAIRKEIDDNINFVK